MQIFHRNFNLSFDPFALLLLSFCFLFIPIQWLFAWIFAAAMHELSHLSVLYFFGVKICGVRIGVYGAQIHTAPLSGRIECISAVAGPFCGILLVFLGRWIPKIAICAFFQTICNLIPYRNHDGGRILYCLLRRWISGKKCDQIFQIIEAVITITGFTAVIWIGIRLSRVLAISLLAFSVLRTIIGAKTPCKQRQQIVQ